MTHLERRAQVLTDFMNVFAAEDVPGIWERQIRLAKEFDRGLVFVEPGPGLYFGNANTHSLLIRPCRFLEKGRGA